MIISYILAIIALLSAIPVSAGDNSRMESRIEVIEPSPVKEIVVPVTGYSSTPDQTDDTPFITASNSYVRDGIVAANFLPFGAKIKIPEAFGDKIFVVEDRMHKRFEQRIDVWFPDRESALEFGYQELKVHIIE